MSALALLVALAQAVPLPQGQAAPFDGVLWPPDKTREALTCMRVDLPDCERRLVLQLVEVKAALGACEAALGACRGRPLAEPPPDQPTPWVGYLSAGAVGALAGALVVALVR